MDAYPSSHVKMALLLAISLVILIVALPAHETPRGGDDPVSLAINEAEATPAAAETEPQAATPGDVVAPAATPANEVSPEADLKWQDFSVRAGDSMSTLFHRAGLSPGSLHAVMTSGGDAGALRNIRPGHNVAMKIDDDGALIALRYDESPLKNLLVSRTGDNAYKAQWHNVKPEVLISYATGTISDETPSLFLAAKKAGLSDNITMKLANIFQWDISFALDLRKGDSFALMYEEIYVDGEKVKEGNIVAAQFDNMGQNYEAVLFTDDNDKQGYYAPDGRSMHKAFLRDPVHFSHISSRFNLKRMHPIFHRVMPHRGIDYAAKRGTPVMASGDGRVTIARQNNASGRYVVIQHGEQYTTKYLHLSKFGRGIRPGVSVKQGQVIGYVGMSGWATAPHLHYEFLVNGVHRNPRTVPLPQAKPIPAAEMARFRKVTQPVLARLDSIVGNTGYAMADQAIPAKPDVR